jgi:hypothetical protein
MYKTTVTEQGGVGVASQYDVAKAAEVARV